MLFIYNCFVRTRVELWKDYRKEINNNIELQNAVQYSNEKLNIIYKRLKNVFPGYEQKYSLGLSKINIEVDETPTVKKIVQDEVQNLLNKLNEVNEDDVIAVTSYDKLDFSSHALDEVIEILSSKKDEISSLINFNDTEGFSMNAVEVIEIKKLGEEEKKERKKINIAIDGPSGSGKSTIAKIIAKKYGMQYLNTGLTYRAIALNAIEEHANLENPQEVISTMKPNMIEIKNNEVILLNGFDVSRAVRADDVSQGASKIAAIPEIRQWVNNLHRQFAAQKGVIMDGRDTTFRVLPDAELKIFLDTDPETRAKRRVEQNAALGYSLDYDRVLNDIKERDYRDRNREVDPLHKTQDAILIDASHLNIDEVVSIISRLVEERM